MRINFCTKTPLSLLDLTTLGGSSKKGDETKIGQFNSGLKYAMSIFLRNNVKFGATIKTINRNSQNLTYHYSLGKTVVEDFDTNKEKELIVLYRERMFHEPTFKPKPWFIETPNEFSTEIIETGLSVELGFDWKLEFALREIYSNMLDEGGFYVEGHDIDENFLTGEQWSIIMLEFDDDSDFGNIWKRKDELFKKDGDVIHTFKNGYREVKVRKNNNGKSKIYKQGILVHESQNYESFYNYDINFGILDERRVLNDVYSTTCNIAEVICRDTRSETIEFLLNTESDEGNFFPRDPYFTTPSKELIEKVIEMGGEIKTFTFIREMLKKVPNSPLNGRRMKTLSESYYEVQKEVIVEETPKQIEVIPEKMELIDHLKSKYDFDFKFPIKEATIKGSRVVADKFNKIILINEDFDYENEDDLIELFIQMFELMDGDKNVIRKMVKFIIQKITK